MQDLDNRKRIAAAQLLGSAAACNACHSAMTQADAVECVARTLADEPGAISPEAARSIAVSFVNFVYFSKGDAKFLPTMRQRAQGLAQRLLEYRVTCAPFILACV